MDSPLAPVATHQEPHPAQLPASHCADQPASYHCVGAAERGRPRACGSGAAWRAQRVGSSRASVI